MAWIKHPDVDCRYLPQGCHSFEVENVTVTPAVPVSSIICPAGSISAAAYDVLKELFHSRHGCMQDIAAAVLPRLTPLMVGAVLQQGKRTASEVAASRAAAVMFVRDVYR